MQEFKTVQEIIHCFEDKQKNLDFWTDFVRACTDKNIDITYANQGQLKEKLVGIFQNAINAASAEQTAKLYQESFLWQVPSHIDQALILGLFLSDAIKKCIDNKSKPEEKSPMPSAEEKKEVSSTILFSDNGLPLVNSLDEAKEIFSQNTNKNLAFCEALLVACEKNHVDFQSQVSLKYQVLTHVLKQVFPFLFKEEKLEAIAVFRNELEKWQIPSSLTEEQKVKITTIQYVMKSLCLQQINENPPSPKETTVSVVTTPEPVLETPQQDIQPKMKENTEPSSVNEAALFVPVETEITKQPEVQTKENPAQVKEKEEERNETEIIATQPVKSSTEMIAAVDVNQTDSGQELIEDEKENKKEKEKIEERVEETVGESENVTRPLPELPKSQESLNSLSNINDIKLLLADDRQEEFMDLLLVKCNQIDFDSDGTDDANQKLYESICTVFASFFQWDLADSDLKTIEEISVMVKTFAAEQEQSFDDLFDHMYDAEAIAKQKKIQAIKSAMVRFFDDQVASKKMLSHLGDGSSSVKETTPSSTGVLPEHNSVESDHENDNNIVIVQAILHEISVYKDKLEQQISQASDKNKTIFENRETDILTLEIILNNSQKTTTQKLNNFEQKFTEIKKKQKTEASKTFAKHRDPALARFLYRVTNLLTIGLMHKARTGHWGLWVTKTEGERTLTRIDKKLQAVRSQR